MATLGWEFSGMAGAGWTFCTRCTAPPGGPLCVPKALPAATDRHPAVDRSTGDCGLGKGQKRWASKCWECLAVDFSEGKWLWCVRWRWLSRPSGTTDQAVKSRQKGLHRDPLKFSCRDKNRASLPPILRTNLATLRSTPPPPSRRLPCRLPFCISSSKGSVFAP